MTTAAEYAKMLSEIDTAMELLEARRKDIINAITTQFPADGTTHEGGLTVSPGVKRINTRKIQNLYPADQYPQIYKTETKPDTKLIRKHISEVELEEKDVFDIGQPRVTVKECD